MAESFNKKCIIETTAELGRYVKAKEKLAAGEFVLLERPIIIIAANEERRCDNCFKLAHSYCRICQITNLCLHCTQHNQYDCKLLASMANVDWKLLNRYSKCFGIIKCLLLQENPETKQYFDLMLQAVSHLEKRRGTEVWTLCNENIVGPILKSGIMNSLPSCSTQINEDFLQRLCAVVDVNVFEIRAPDCGSMKGVYINGVLLSHDCTANTQYSIDDKYCMKTYANQDIDAGKAVTNCYTNVVLGTAERRHILLEGKYFHCTCPRCEDPTELGSHMSSLICAPCAANNREGFIVQNHTKKAWQCYTCNHTLRNEQVENILERVKEEVFHAQDDVRRYEILLAKLTTILHQNHYIMIDIKQNIANILRSIIMTSLQRPGRRLYERKVRLCQELVMVLHLILPGISRLKGIALYELANASAELYRLRFGEKELTQQELQDDLRKCEAMLKESVRMLLYEPPESPEGQLAKSIMNEIKDLRNDMQLLDNPLEENVTISE